MLLNFYIVEWLALNVTQSIKIYDCLTLLKCYMIPVRKILFINMHALGWRLFSKVNLLHFHRLSFFIPGVQPKMIKNVSSRAADVYSINCTDKFIMPNSVTHNVTTR